MVPLRGIELLRGAAGTGVEGPRRWVAQTSMSHHSLFTIELDRCVTTQVPDCLMRQGVEFPILSEPLDPYIRMTDVNLHSPDVWNSSCWRGYIASWEVLDDHLYLVGIEGISASYPLSLESLFPGFDQRVFAHWFSGTVIVPADDHSPQPFLSTFRVREGQVIEPPREGRAGCLAVQIASSYDDYAPALSDLSRPRLIPEIEVEEIVSDPLGAVPAAPFGHMNWKWEEFKVSVTPGTAVWRFSYSWGGGQLHGGYATVEHDRIDRFVLTSIRELDY